ncbi:D-xylulose 5-phosphate/D-fructose 6-phosphate phosphoketolase [Sesbania bispinosa]|nr:D-xylulose 5-phosphate/D-fructose 6-phosphate phosphoketolase [Sesbania bispinosa]
MKQGKKEGKMLGFKNAPLWLLRLVIDQLPPMRVVILWLSSSFGQNQTVRWWRSRPEIFVLPFLI